MFKKFAFVTVLTLAVASCSDAMSGFVNVGRGEDLDTTIQASAGVSRMDSIMYPGATYIAVRFEDFNLPDGDEVLVRTPDSKTIHRYTGKGRNDAGSFVSSSIPGDKAVVEYISKNKLGSTSPSAYTISSFARGDSVAYENASRCGKDQTLAAKCFKDNSKLVQDLPQAYNKARAVARLLVNGTISCSAWLAGSEGHLITSGWCVWSPEAAMVTEVEFDAESQCWENSKVPMGNRGIVVKGNPTFITRDKYTDYTLLKLPSDVDVSSYGYLQFRGGGAQVGEEIYIPQHPYGYQKRIGYKEENGHKATIKEIEISNGCGSNQINYELDAYESYGAPVLSSKDNLVVAIQHCPSCTSSGVHPVDVINDLKSKKIVVKDLVVGDTPQSVPRPPQPKRGFCGLFSENRLGCLAWLWCSYNYDTSKCEHK